MEKKTTEKAEKQYSINLPDKYRLALKKEALAKDTTVRQIFLGMLKARYGE